MDDEEYIDAVNSISLWARNISMINIEELLRILDRAENIGYLFVEPLDCARGLDNLKRQKKFLHAANNLKRVVLGIQEGASDGE